MARIYIKGIIMKYYLAVFFMTLLSGCTIKNESRIVVEINEVKENELTNLFPIFSQLNPNMSKENFISNYKQVKDKEYYLYQAIIDENNKKHAIGLIGYIFNEDLCVGRAMYIDVLVVDKNYRNKGIAKQLMDFAISKLHQDKKAHCIRWTTRNDLHEAINFYNKKIQKPTGYYYRINNTAFEK
jgi:ribosomal protein S18 acetylase RimI-like enzyme